MAEKWILIRREKTFLLHPADEKIDPTLVPRISLDELPKRGRMELVQVSIPAKGWLANDVLPDVKKLLGPFGSVVPLRNDSLVVQDTAGNIAKIQKTLDELTAKKP